MLYLFSIVYGLTLSVAMGILVCMDQSQSWGDLVSLFVLNPVMFVLGPLLFFSCLPKSTHEAVDRKVMKTERQARIGVLVAFLAGLISAYGVARFF